MFELLPRPLGAIFRKLTHLTCNLPPILFLGHPSTLHFNTLTQQPPHLFKNENRNRFHSLSDFEQKFFRTKFSFYVILIPVMPRKRYTHSPYWKGKKAAKPHSYVAQLLGEFSAGDEKYRNSSSYPLHPYAGADAANALLFGSLFLSVALIADIGNAVRYEIKRIADPNEREIMKRELMIELKKLRRPFYYQQENERRRALAKARRKIRRRSTLSPEPTPEQIMEAWNHRKESKEAMIKLGGMLQDLECYVDNCLEIDDRGVVLGRRRGIRGWIANCLPELLPKYKTLMRYKAMAIKLRQATDVKDPKPTKCLLRKPYHPVVEEIFSSPQVTFACILDVIDRHISPDRIFDG